MLLLVTPSDGVPLGMLGVQWILLSSNLGFLWSLWSPSEVSCHVGAVLGTDMSAG